MTREEAFHVIDTYCVPSAYPHTEQWGILQKIKEALEVLKQNPKVGHCEECKHFRKFPYHADKLGKCIQHTKLCPKSDWYCADYEPQENCDTCKHKEESWDSEHCDGCCGNHSGFETQGSEEV